MHNVQSDLFIFVRDVVVELSKHRKRSSDSDVKSKIKRPQHQRRNRLTIIDCQKCQLLSARNMLRDTLLNHE